MRDWFRLLEIASDHRLAVFVHCGAISVGVRKKLGLPSQFDLRFSNPLHLHPVALHFPQIRFVVPHFGAGLFRETLMLADLCPNVWLDTSSSNRWMAYEDLDLRSVFRRSIDVLGVERLLFGTDSSFFPRGWNASVFQQQTTALYELGLDAEQAAQILYLNLERLLEPRVSAARSGVLRNNLNHTIPPPPYFVPESPNRCDFPWTSGDFALRMQGAANSPFPPRPICAWPK